MPSCRIIGKKGVWTYNSNVALANVLDRCHLLAIYYLHWIRLNCISHLCVGGDPVTITCKNILTFVSLCLVSVKSFSSQTFHYLEDHVTMAVLIDEWCIPVLSHSIYQHPWERICKRRAAINHAHNRQHLSTRCNVNLRTFLLVKWYCYGFQYGLSGFTVTDLRTCRQGPCTRLQAPDYCSHHLWRLLLLPYCPLICNPHFPRQALD